MIVGATKFLWGRRFRPSLVRAALRPAQRHAATSAQPPYLQRRLSGRSPDQEWRCREASSGSPNRPEPLTIGKLGPRSRPAGHTSHRSRRDGLRITLAGELRPSRRSDDGGRFRRGKGHLFQGRAERRTHIVGYAPDGASPGKPIVSLRVSLAERRLCTICA